MLPVEMKWWECLDMRGRFAILARMGDMQKGLGFQIWDKRGRSDVLFSVRHFWVSETETYEQHFVVLKFSLFCPLCNF